MTPQAVARFRRRFGDRVAVLHSRLGAGERRDEWQRLRSGEATDLRRPALGGLRAGRRPGPDRRRRGARPLLQAGGRSALRRARGRPPPGRRGGGGARRAARRRRARRAGASWSGSSCPSRVDGRPLPAVEVRRHARPRRRRRARFTRARARRSPTLRDAGGKAIVLINRRGWSAHLSCRVLRARLECPDCDVSLVVHRGAGELALPPLRPRRAAALERARLRLGDPRARRRRQRAGRGGAGRRRGPARRSSGSTPTAAAGRRPPRDPRAASSAAESGVLVGTQMVAKGHDFPDVVLGVVLDADATPAVSRLPRRGADLRAGLAARRAQRPRRARRAGCSCRRWRPRRRRSATRPATTRPASSPASSSVARELGYPPFSHLIRVELTGADVAAARRAAARAARGARRRPAGARRGRSARRRASASAAASAASCSSRRRARARRSPPSARRSRPPRRPRELREVAIAVDVDPQ